MADRLARESTRVAITPVAKPTLYRAATQAAITPVAISRLNQFVTRVALLVNIPVYPTGISSGAAVGTPAITGGAPPSYSNTVLTDSPVMYLPMQETSGTVATDISGNNFHGSYINGATVNDVTDTAAPVGLSRHVRLDGTDDAVTLPAGETWFTPATAGYTFEAWFYVRSWPNWVRLYDFTNNINTSDIYLTNSNDGVNLSLGASGSAFNVARSSITLNSWAHVVVTVTTAGAGKVYVNGTSVATGTCGAPANGTRARMNIGKAAFTGDPTAVMSLCHVAVYLSVLPAARVTAHYAARNFQSLAPTGIASTGTVGTPVVTQPAIPAWSIWNGTTEAPATVTVWNGTTELAATTEMAV